MEFALRQPEANTPEIEIIEVRRPSKLRTVAIGVGLSATMASCIQYEGPAGNAAECLVMVTGDSTTGLAANDIRNQVIDVDTSLTLRAVSGETIGGMLDELEAQATNPLGIPDVAVVYLGTNNVRLETPNWEAEFAAMIEILKSIPQVHLVTVNEWVSPDGVSGAAVNAAIDKVVSDYPDQFHRQEWNINWPEEAGPGSPDDPGPHYYTVYVGPGVYVELPNGGWVSDAVHQSPAGSAELARLYAAAVDATCPVSE